VAIQEIMDISQDAFPFLVGELNKQAGNAFDFIMSIRVGRTQSKEQHAFIFR
jgi:hypothetical protein